MMNFIIFMILLSIVSGSKTLVVLLGSSNNELLFDRINTATSHVLSSDNQIDWFLSGGYTSDKTISEAQKMQNIISTYKQSNNTWNFILDEMAQNTSENLVYLQSWLETIDYKYTNMKLVTSKFHENRAKTMISKLSKLSLYNWDWVSGPLAFHDSYYWETVHIKNVDTDISKALLKINQ